ncbi:MAG TPA: metalloregulator ArsR/SmtB family transcription factor [Abditibacteriaceae bacterium]|jgi:ArsR family transcriptional regulator
MKQIRETIKPVLRPDANDDELAKLAHAVAHPARVAIVRLLRERQACLCGEIVEVLPLAQSTVSQHLKVLKEAGWVQGEIDGPRVCYCLNPIALEKFGSLIAGL